MNTHDVSSEREAVVEKLAQVPDESIQIISSFLDSIIEQYTNTSETEPLQETESEVNLKAAKTRSNSKFQTTDTQNPLFLVRLKSWSNLTSSPERLKPSKLAPR